MTDSKTPLTPKLATQDAAARLVDLLCSASPEIGLNEDVCSPEKYPMLLEWMKGQCEARRVWTLAEGPTLQGMLILKENAAGILYVVVAESFRCRGLGPALIRHIQSLGVESLSAEARNDRSRRMLERCGFVASDRSRYGYPILLWQSEPAQ